MDPNTVLSDILVAVVAVVVPILAGYLRMYIKQAGANLAAKENATITDQRLSEIATAVADAVALVSQTYVDALKREGRFDLQAQQSAAQQALAACVSMLEYPTMQWLTEAFGDAKSYLANKIEAEVREQKLEYDAATGAK